MNPGFGRAMPAIGRTLITWSGVSLTLVLLMAATALPVQGAAPRQRPEVGRAVAPVSFDGDLRALPRAVPSAGRPVNVNPHPRSGRPTADAPSAPDPLLERATTSPSSFDATLLEFKGLSNTDVSNPDTVGDVGRRQYIQMVNASGGTTFAIWRKDGTPLVGPTLLNSLAAPGSRCKNGAGDPIVVYDQLANRWLLSEITEKVEGKRDFLCVYVSKNANPVTGGWWIYQFRAKSFPDYPKYAVWPDAYYVSANESDNPGADDTAAAYALERDQMLDGDPARKIRFATDQLPQFVGFNQLMPADLEGFVRPGPSTPAYYVRHVDDEFHFDVSTATDYLEAWAFHVDWGTPASSTFTRLPDIEIADFDSTICDGGAFECISQPGTDQLLDALREQTMWRVTYRVLPNREFLVGNFTVDATGADQAGIRWFAVARPTSASPWSVKQEGTYAPDGSHRWMGSIAMNKCGDLALGYSVSSDSVHPGIRYAGRKRLDPAGALPRGENSIIEGTGSYTAFNRWGDYSSMNVDPIDDSTLWYTNQFTNAAGEWKTRVAVFRFKGCD